MKALILDASARTATLRTIPSPSPKPNELLIRVLAICLNPIDPLHVHHPLARSSRTIGSDLAGTVSLLGADVPASSGLQVGSKVAGFLQSACSVNDRPGAFAGFLDVPWDLVWAIPGAVGVEEAAGVSLIALTATQAIWYRLGLPAPFAYDGGGAEHARVECARTTSKSGLEPVNFFIYGALTSVGPYAAQMVRLSGQASGRRVRLYGAASPARWSMLRSEPYGYDHLVDYRAADWPEQIRTLSGGAGMQYVYDCISEARSVEQACAILAEGG